MGTMVVRPGQQTTFAFPFVMHPGMGGKHHFTVTVKTNDPQSPQLSFHVYANAIETRQ